MFYLIDNLRIKPVLIFITGLFVLVNIVLYYQFGVNLPFDTPRYTGYADQMLNEGRFYQPHEVWYFGYAAFLACLKLFTSDPLLWCLVQVLIQLVAINFLCYAIYCKWRSSVMAFLPGLMLILFYEIPMWNYYILTESLYISGIITLLGILILLNPLRLYHCLIAVLFTGVVFMIRPNGVLLLPALLFWMLAPRWKYFSVSMKVVIIFLGIAGSFFILNQMLTTFDLLRNYKKGEVVFGAGSVKNYNVTGLLLPHPSVPETESENTFTRLGDFLYREPLYFLKLSLLRGFYYVLHVKPYYSVLHNIFIAVFLYPVYIFAALGLFRSSSSPLKSFSIAFILLNIGMVMITSIDWDGRFFVPILPVVMVWAARGIRLMPFSGNKHDKFRIHNSS